MFEEQVERTPDAVALVFEQEYLSYQELNDRANRLASYLRLAGVTLETPVGICFEQTSASIIAVLAVLKAGGMYAPLDPASPPERLTALIQAASPLLVLTQANLLERLPTHLVPCDTLTNVWAQTTQLSGENRNSTVYPTNAAYLLYTSGSTGTPKGVIVEHRQVVSYIAAVGERVAFASPASFAMLQPLTVDSCLTMLFPALLTGGTLHLISREKALDAESQAESFSHTSADYLKIAPSHLAALLSGASTQYLLPRLGLIIGGEASQWEWTQHVRAQLPTGSQLYNHYGPTETTVGSLMFQEWDSVSWSQALTPLGRPLANTRIYVLDRHLQPLPVGVVGELYIAGAGLARGYLTRPDLTAERFLPDPFVGTLLTDQLSEARHDSGVVDRNFKQRFTASSGDLSPPPTSLPSGERMYRTGDLVIYQSDGTIGFVGRNDEQVKIRGYRIEPGEIEAVLLQHPAIRDALVIAQEDATGEKRLVAYVIPGNMAEPEQVLRSALRHHLNARLPLYMHPARIVRLEAFPLTIHGKVDRRALARAEIEAQPEEETSFVAPGNAVEEALAEIWTDVLHVKQVGIYDNFFELGGHSLLATQILSRVREFFQIKLPLRTIFAAPTIAALAEAIIQKTIEEADSDTIAQILARQE